MKTFYSAQEIEDLARQGVRELVVDDNVVLTDLARQMAGQLGLRLVAAASAARPQAPAPTPAAPRPPADGSVRPAPLSAAPVPAKPKGCQRATAPAATNGQAVLAATPSNGSANGHVVDDLVGVVKQMSKR